MSSKDWSRVSNFSRSLSDNKIQARVYHPATNLMPASPDAFPPNSQPFDFTKKTASQPGLVRSNSSQSKS